MADTETAIGFFRGDKLPTRDTPLTSANCTTSNYGGPLRRAGQSDLDLVSDGVDPADAVPGILGRPLL